MALVNLETMQRIDQKELSEDTSDSLGTIIGKSTTTRFEFLINNNVNKLEYIMVKHPEHGEVLAQIVEIWHTAQKNLAKCLVIGYQNKNGKICSLKSPFHLGSEVYIADDTLIRKIIKLEAKNSKTAFIGHLEGKDIPVNLDLNKVLSKHVCVLAKSGSGKSYCVGVLIEEIIDKKVPLIIIDPHGEYSTLTQKNDNKDEKALMKRFNVKPKSYKGAIEEYGDIKINSNIKPIKLDNNIGKNELMHMLPTRLNNTQKGVLYGVLKNMDKIDFDSLILELEMEESSSKWNIINIIDYIRKLDLFSYAPTLLSELVQPGKCSILNMKGIPPDVQEIIVYKLTKDLFEARKIGEVPPFFMVIEEAHNFCPERLFGETKCSTILRTVASEGRKFGLGLCIVSQRPARVDKSVISQCNTQIILKVTNPNDLKAISNSVEGTTQETEEEIRNLPIGTALVTGVVDMPLFVNIRPRKSKHGGAEIDMLSELDNDDVLKEIKEFSKKDIMPIIRPKTSLKDLKLMSERPIQDVKTYLIPSLLLTSKKNFNILVDRIKGEILVDLDSNKSKVIPDLGSISSAELSVLKTVFISKEITMDELAIKSKIPALKLKNHISNLLKIGYIVLDNKIKLNQKMVFDSLANYAFYDKIEFISVEYDNKLKPKLSVEHITKKISDYTDIIDSKECFIVFYEIKYKD